MDARRQTQELRRRIEWALSRTVDPGDVLPLLHRLARLSEPASDESLFAYLHLGELLVERDPWRAALYARRVVSHRPDDDRGWATLALCQTLLGNYRFAVRAYHHAIASAPKNPWYAHNLGHLLDVALGRADEAVGWLKHAYQSAAYSGEVAASYAHALARVGRIADARRVLTRATKRATSREHAAMLRWLEEGAPPDKDHPLPRPAPIQAMTSCEGDERDQALRGRRRDKSLRSPLVSELEAVLSRGLASLPLDGKQRTRARALARDSISYFKKPAGSKGSAAVQAVAAAIAYAIVYVDHVPLTQAEVAASFRVGVAGLRARFSELRTHLDLTPGDARYATLRRH